MYAHEIDHRTTGVAFGNWTLGGVPATASAGLDGPGDECPGAVPGEPTVPDASARAARIGGIAHV